MKEKTVTKEIRNVYGRVGLFVEKNRRFLFRLLMQNDEWDAWTHSKSFFNTIVSTYRMVVNYSIE